jgi:hypothetical protein
MFDNMGVHDDVVADRTHERYISILDKVRAEVRATMTKEVIATRKSELLKVKEELCNQASMRFKKRTDWNALYKLALSKKGQMVVRATEPFK